MTSARVPATLGEVLSQWEEPDSTAGLVYASSSGDDDFRQSYAELLADARRRLAVLREEGMRPGDKVILLLTSSQEVLPAFWACVLGGMVPAVLSVPKSVRRDTEPMRKLQHVWKLLEEPTVVLDAGHDAALARLPEGEHPLPGLRSITYAHLATGDRLAEEHRGSPQDLAMLQFSSGSTGTPRGVRLTNSNLMANLSDMVPHWDATGDDTFVSWMPESHDMGLICMHMMPLVAGSSQVKLSPLAFVRNPLSLLEAIHRHGGTITAAPNFALALLLEKALDGEPPQVDLSTLRVFGNAAEPISVDVMRRFVEACEPLGMRPEAMTCCYGLAEGTVGVTSTYPSEPASAVRLDRDAFYQRKLVPASDSDETAVEIACLGRTVGSVTLRITDEEDRPLPDEHIGHVQLKGPTITSGYYAEAVAPEDLFVDGWLRTGDLGFTRGGELYLTGRVKDVIFVQGNNVYAADVEARVTELSPLWHGEVVACGYTDWDTGTERLAVFVKGRRVDLTDDDLLELRQRLFEVLGLRVDVILRVPAVPRTTSGKLQRHKLAESLQAGELRAQVEHWEHLCRERTRSGPRSVGEALGATAPIAGTAPATLRP